MHLALGQAPIILGDIEKNLEIMENLIKNAQEKCNGKLKLGQKLLICCCLKFALHHLSEQMARST